MRRTAAGTTQPEQPLLPPVFMPSWNNKTRNNEPFNPAQFAVFQPAPSPPPTDKPRNFTGSTHNINDVERRKRILGANESSANHLCCAACFHVRSQESVSGVAAVCPTSGCAGGEAALRFLEPILRADWSAGLCA